MGRIPILKMKKELQVKIKNTIFILTLTVFLSVTNLSAQSTTKPLSGMCIALVHGILGFDDTNGLAGGRVKYWGGVDQ